MKHPRLQVLLNFLLPGMFAVLLQGCAGTGQYPFQSPQQYGSGIMVTTQSEDHLFFRDEQWELTWSGIHGTAEIHTFDGASWTADTTLSYLDAAAAQPIDRGGGMKNYLLTVLGIILVLGLAAIILYAAFLATDR